MDTPLLLPTDMDTILVTDFLALIDSAKRINRFHGNKTFYANKVLPFSVNVL